MPITRSLPLCRRTFVNDLAFNLIMDCGQAMLANGGEVFRAQDTMEIMARSFGIVDFHVYVLTNGIFASAQNGTVSAVRHVPVVSTNLGHVEAINAISRRVADGELDLNSAQLEFERMKRMPTLSPLYNCAAGTMGAGCFAMLARRQVEPKQEKLPQGQCVLAALLVFLLVCRFWCVLVTGWKPANVATANLKQITAGPAAGTWADEKAADMQMALYEALEPFAGKQVLQAIGEQHGLGFMMAGGTLTIGQASVISGTDSDPRFIQYYEELPEKRPDVILYDEAEVRDMAAFHAWIEENFTITARYPVTHGTAHLQVLVVD
jgi:hypothetical protein